MKRFFGAAVAAFAITSLAAPATQAASPGAVSVAATPQAAVDELLAADRAFAAVAANSNVVGALSAMFADEVVMPTAPATFARGKAAATEALRANPANLTSKIGWTPVRGGISADGQHGFTYGFTTLTEPGKPDRPGKYLAYWVKTPEGWRVTALRRVPRPAGEVSTAMMAPSLPAHLVAVNAAAVPAHAASLAAAEAAFATEAKKIGLGPAFAKYGRADAMNMGRDAGFTIGAANIGAGLGSDRAEAPDWGADAGTLVASSGDLGVNFGYIRPKSPPPGAPAAAPFFTIWRRDSPKEPWRYIAE